MDEHYYGGIFFGKNKFPILIPRRSGRSSSDSCMKGLYIPILMGIPVLSSSVYVCML